MLPLFTVNDGSGEGPLPDSAVTSADSHADLVERLFREFEHRHARTDILAVIRAAQTDLAGSPPAALPELVERLARQRLSAAPS